MKLFDAIADPDLLSRRLGIAACNVISEEDVPKLEKHEQMSIFDLGREEEDTAEDDEKLAKERALQEAMLEMDMYLPVSIGQSFALEGVRAGDYTLTITSPGEGWIPKSKEAVIWMTSIVYLIRSGDASITSCLRRNTAEESYTKKSRRISEKSCGSCVSRNMWKLSKQSCARIMCICL